MCVDRERFDHYIATDFEFASSPLDVSVINPFAGMGGLSQPWAVWLNPVYLLPHILPPIRQWDTLPSTREWAWGYLVAIFFMAAGAYCLARAVGLPYYLRVIAAQVLGICFFSPVGYWTFARGIGANFWRSRPQRLHGSVLRGVLLGRFHGFGEVVLPRQPSACGPPADPARLYCSVRSDLRGDVSLLALGVFPARRLLHQRFAASLQVANDRRGGLPRRGTGRQYSGTRQRLRKLCQPVRLPE